MDFWPFKQVVAVQAQPVICWLNLFILYA